MQKITFVSLSVKVAEEEGGGSRGSIVDARSLLLNFTVMPSSAIPKAASDDPHGSLLESNANWGPPDAAEATTFFRFNSCIISFNGLKLGFEDRSSLISGKYLEVVLLPVVAVLIL